MGDDPFMRNQNAAVRGAAKGQNRTNVLQLKMMGQAQPTGLTPTLLKLFEARPPLEFKPPPEKRKMPSYAGIAEFVAHFAEKGDPEYAPPVPTVETPAERMARIHKLRLEKGAANVAEELEKCEMTQLMILLFQEIHTRLCLLLGLIMRPARVKLKESSNLMDQ